MSSDTGQSINLPSIKGRVTKWASGRITMELGQRTAWANNSKSGLYVEVEINAKDAKELIALVNTEVER